MGTIIGNYVKTFAEADMGMLEGASLNAPYPFHWVYLTAIEGNTIVCEGGRETLRLPLKKTKHGERASVVVRDPIFGPQTFPVAPFLRRDARGIGATPDLFAEPRP